MLSECGFFNFQLFNKEYCSLYCNSRTGEKKLGELDLFEGPSKKYKILGISESIGPRANFGLKGSEKGFSSFLNYFLNSQSTGFPYETVGILGEIQLRQPVDNNFNQHVLNLDKFVENVLFKYFKKDEIPIVIGGGHNNALPIMRWVKKLYNPPSCHILNIDPHADCRDPSDRHSGNSFSIALKEKVIEKYSVLGLHEAYNNTFIETFLNKNSIYHTFFEDYIFKNRNIEKDISEAIRLNGKHLGIEIDMDSISNFPSSAKSPCGWNFNEIRFILNVILKNKESVFYLHLPESAPKDIEEEKIVGKLLTYVVRDFVIFMNKT